MRNGIGLIFFFFLVAFSLQAQLSDPAFVSEGVLEKLTKINTDGSELSPQYYGDGIAYVLYQKKSKEDKPTRGEFIFDIMYIDDSSNEPESFADEINSKFVEGPFCGIKKELFFTRSNNSLSDDGKRRLKIYHAYELENGSWTKPERIELPEGDFNYCHPALNATGDLMIFASDLPGGFGKMDLYVTELNEEVWSRPVNLGPEVNGPGNDWLPFLYQDKLYYGSDSYTSNGDIDLYEGILDKNGVVVSSTALPEPINSEADEFGLHVHPDGKRIIFSSNRAGSKGDDLYEIKFKTTLNKPEIPKSLLLELELRDNKTNDPVPNANIELTIVDLEAYGLNDYDVDAILDKSGKMEHATSFNLSTSLDGSLEFKVDRDRKYVLIITKDGYRESRFFFDPLVDEPSWLIMMDPKVVKKVTPPPPPPPVRVVKKPIIIPTKKGEAIVFNNIYYEFNSDKIIPGAQAELEALSNAMLQNPNLKIKLVSHTDAQGNDAYNMDLSTRRAISARQYLENQGVLSYRIKTEGRGETQIRNHCINNVTCGEEDHRFNRRTEVIILEN